MRLIFAQIFSFLFSLSLGMFIADIITQGPLQKVYALEADGINRRVTTVLVGVVVDLAGLALIMLETPTEHLMPLIFAGTAAGILVNGLIITHLLKSHQQQGKDPKQK